MSNPSATPAAPGQAIPAVRRIALVDDLTTTEMPAIPDPAQHPMRLLETLLWALRGMTREAWTKSSPDDADIIVVPRGGERARRIAWKGKGKVIVELVPKGSEANADTNSLVFPFRAADVIALLERMSTLLEPKSVTRTDLRSANPWRFMEKLRAVRDLGDANQWLVASDRSTPLLWMRGDAGTYKAAAETVAALRHGELSLNSLSLGMEAASPDQLEHRLGSELCWHAGYQSSDVLAPWLQPTARFRITQWPNLSSIRPHPSLMRIVSALSAAPANLDELIARTRAAPDVTARTLNALSATESIVTEQTPLRAPRAAPSIATPAGGFKNFFRSMRKHLGLDTP
ncbi:MAG TPA: hypothetical protein VMF52_09550 [Steroidobacteraceae bacterium]|nr:hypothetical protein [Steroidobacteraceae bacterium]